MGICISKSSTSVQQREKSDGTASFEEAHHVKPIAIATSTVEPAATSSNLVQVCICMHVTAACMHAVEPASTSSTLALYRYSISLSGPIILSKVHEQQNIMHEINTIFDPCRAVAFFFRIWSKDSERRRRIYVVYKTNPVTWTLIKVTVTGDLFLRSRYD